MQETPMLEPDAGLRERLIHVCVNVDCQLRGSERVRDRLEQLIEERDLDLEVNNYICFAACEEGPNLLIEHTRSFCSGVQPADAEAVLDHALGGAALERIDRTDSFLARKIFNMLDAGFRPGELSRTD
jgi:(2Fe-2S) ferredoxin